MAKNLQFQINYTGQGYLDSKTSVASFSELAQKWDFEGQSVSMPTAFMGKNDIPYPIDFWLTPYGEIDKWEIKTMPAIESEEDLERFKIFVEDFKKELEYYPMSIGFEFFANGEKYVFDIDENEAAVYSAAQASMDELINHTVELAVEDAVNKITSGASEAFDTLKEVEEWINENSGKTADLTGYVKQEDLEGYVKTEELPSMEEYATKDYVDGKVGEIVVPTLDGYATEAWVTEQGFLTEHQDITGKQDVIEDLEAIREGAAKGATALQEVPEGYATEAWVSEQGFLTEHQSLEGLATEQFVTDRISEIQIPETDHLATKEEVNEIVKQIPSIDGLATETYVDEKVAAIEVPSVEGLASEQFVTDKIAEIEIPSVEGLASEEWVKQQNYLTEHQSLDGLATEEYVNEKVAAIEVPSVEGLATEEFVINKIAEAELGGEDVDLSGYATKTELQEVANSIPSVEGLASEQFVTDKIAEIEIPSVEGLATEAYVDEKIAAIEVPSVEGLASEEWVKQQNYLTEHQSLEGLASENYVDEKIAAIEIPTVEGLASEQFVADRIAEIEIPSVEGFASEQFVTDRIAEIEIPSVEGLATEAYVDEKVAAIEFPETDLTGYATEAWVAEQGFLTEHQDITGKQDVIEDLEAIREGAAKGATALQEVPEGYATEAWVTEQGFLTEHQDISGLATKEEVAIVSGSIKSVIEDLLIPENAKETLDTLEEISAWIQSHPEDAASMNAQIVALQESAHTHENKGVLDGITTEKVVAWDAAEANAKAYADDEIAKLSDVYAKKTDLEGLATETWVSAEIAKAQLEGEDIDLSGYATKDDIKGLASEQFVTDEIAKIEIPTLEGYATEAWVGEQGFLTEHQDITGKQDVIEDLEVIREGAAKGATALQEVPEGYATEAWVGEQGFLTEHQDISGLATKDEVADAVLSAQTYADSLVENLKPYDGGTAVDVVDYTVNVNVAEDGFLKVNEENELTVTGVTLDAAVTSKDITIEGGQWATAVKTVFTGGTVPAGTTWQSFLESMLCVEKFDTSYSMSKTFTVSCGTLGEGITGASNNSSVEVGTKVSLKSFEANPTTASQSYTVSTFDYGYKLGEDGTYNKNTSFKETLTPSLKASNDALTATFTTFVDESGNTIAKISGNTSMGEVKMRVMDGTNKVVIAQTGDTYTASSAVTAGTIYVATNLKNYYKSDKKTPNTYTPSYASEDKTATASTTYTVTGYRNTFYGTTSKTDAADATFIRTLTKSNKAIAAGDTISFDTNSSDGHLRMVIASPRTIKSVKNQTGTQDLTALLVGTKATVNVGGVDNFAPISYNVYDYTWKGAFGNETWIITFA